jgi:hypothetical protein
MIGRWTPSRQLANGTQGRLISWAPEKPDNEKKAFLASHPDLTARFVKEASVGRPELVADLDFIDVAPRQENLTLIPGMPVMVQMALQPCYGLTTARGTVYAPLDLSLFSVLIKLRMNPPAPPNSNIVGISFLETWGGGTVYAPPSLPD